MILKGGGGGHADYGRFGRHGRHGGDTEQPIRLSVVGSAQIFHDMIDTGTGLVPAEITGLQLEGIAVQEERGGGPITVLGPVTVKLGIFRSMGTLGANSGQGRETTTERHRRLLPLPRVRPDGPGPTARWSTPGR